MSCMKNLCRACIIILLVAMMTGVAILIDNLDFVARWLGHIEPYKDNLERLAWVALVVIVFRKSFWRFKDCIKNLKVNAGSFGFEVNLEKENEDVDSDENGSGCLKSDKKAGLTTMVCRNNGREISRRILRLLSDEMQLEFSEDVSLKRGDCNYIPDGFAIRNGRAYIVEVKVADDPNILRRSISRLRAFIQILPKHIQDTTVILCIYSSKKVSDFRRIIDSETACLGTDFIYRVFSKEALEKVD